MLNRLITSPLIMATWWKPWTWGDAVSDATEAIQGVFHSILVGAMEGSLDQMMSIFNSSVSALQKEVALTPEKFDANLVSSLKSISSNVVLPIAGLMITYVFVLQIIEQATNANKGGEWDTLNVIMLIIKTAITISLTTHAFTIGLAFSDLSTWMIDKVPDTEVKMDIDIKDELIDSLEPYVEIDVNEDGNYERHPDNPDEPSGDNERWNYRLGELIVANVVTLLAMVFAFVIGGIMYLTAWSRLIMIMLYVTVAPIPMSTLMSDTWVSSIGQNYLRNLTALMLQGFLMLVLLIIYQGLISRTTMLIGEGEGGYTGLLLLTVSMVTITGLLMKTGNFAKSITGAT